MKRLFIATALLFSGLALTACGSKEATNEKDRVYTLKVSSAINDTHPISEGFRQWSKNVDKRTDGKVKIELLPSGQLGTDEDIIEQAMLGVNVAILTDGGRMGEYVKGLGIVGMPYIGDNYDEMVKITETSTFKKFEDDLSKKVGLRPLAFNWYDGSRNFITNKEIKTPDDLKGQRIRTPGAATWSVSVESLGATPIAMPWTETYNGIQSKAADGAEAQFTAIYTSRMFEVAKYVSKTGHFQLLNGIVAGQKWLDQLPENYREILIEECKKVAEENARYVESKVESYLEEMRKEGMKVTEPDIEAFKEKAEIAYEKLGYKELRDQVWKEIGKDVSAKK